ncbi:LOW QUALITY PROTEIN: polyprotein [Phytophthora megakarya]|uniref:Polyprotein n=1 Tax=Phytophthora megakarya TaxID=4795 RepID=A0A225WZL8_9STRA|nr:LOW QUALITY PROTEIN: polyprotein [Phytophthora megakarya]
MSGIILMMCGAHVVWRSTFQKTVALSSTDAEYMALSECVKEVVWIRLLIKDMGASQSGPTMIYEDNQGAKTLAKNVGYQARWTFATTSSARSVVVELTYMETKNQLADFLTKGLLTTFRYLLECSNITGMLE